MKRTEKYLVTSKPGMTPFGYAFNKAEAEKLSKKAKRLGLEGVVKQLLSR
jgi:hypothetical protein